MGIAFEAPLALLLFIPAFLLTVILHVAARRRVGAGRRRVALVLRSLLLAALVLGLAGLQIVLPVNRLATVFVVDLSDSIGSAGREDALAFVRGALEEMPDGDVAGIVAFGKEALVERLPSDLAEIDRIASAPVRSASDIGGALRLATALFPDDAQKRIVLLSDGNDTTGTGQAEAALSATRGVRIETRQIGLGASDEVLVERASSPSTTRLGEDIEIVSEVRSSVAQPATIRLFVNGIQAGEAQRVDLEEGANTVRFTYTPVEAGFHRFRVVVEAGRDTFSQNNRADSNTIVQGEPRTLVLAGDEVVADDLVAALESQRHQVDTIVPETLPELDQLLDYDSVVLVDVPRIRLNDRQLGSLQAYVRDLGRGLVMVGGPRSYGAGGYQDTQLEETLPVDMGVRDRQKQPDVALVVVIDKSGSMDACHCNTAGGQGDGGNGIGGVRKTDIGKEAILRAAAALTDRDELGIVAFNESAHWVVHTQPLGQVGDLQGAIAGIRPDGQTNIFSGLEAAVDDLEHATATRRHIILLTDGWSSSGQYGDLLERMAAAGITLSTVGAGGGSQNQFLSGLAEQGWRALLRRREPGQHPRHLPQGDPAGLRPADRRGDLLPDRDLLVADPARPRPGLPPAPGLQRDDRQVGGADRAGERARRPAPRPVAVRTRPLRGVDLRLDRPVGRGLGRLERLQPVLQPARQLDVPGRGIGRDRGELRDRGQRDEAARRERRERRLAAGLLLDLGRRRQPDPRYRGR